MLDEIDTLDLRAESDEGLRHRARLQISTRIQRPNREYETVPSEGPEIRVRLSAVGAADAELAAARGVKAQWWLRFPLGTDVKPGQRWRVTGRVKGRAWRRRVTITGDPDPTSRVHVLATAVDEELSR